jgi:hypothetical protein
LKKNKLLILEDKDESDRTVYKVRDSRRLFLITHSKDVALKVFKELKIDYQKQKEQENASKV